MTNCGMLTRELSTATNIKDKNNRKEVLETLNRILERLRTYRQTPRNGLAIYAGYCI